MGLKIEFMKIRRVGLIPTFLVGGFLSAMVPILQMAVSSNTFLQQNGTPVMVLLNSNWQMMAMIHSLLIIVGACILYHLEYADRGRLKMDTLPIREEHFLIAKWCILLVGMIYVLLMDAASLFLCVHIWFPSSESEVADITKQIGFTALAMLPCTLLMLWIASYFKNLWVSLGIGVIGMFLASLIRGEHWFTVLYPFGLLYQTVMSDQMTTQQLVTGILVETILLGGLTIIEETTRRKDR